MQASQPDSEAQDRVTVFIDGSNLYHAMRENLGRTDLNFGEFVRKLCGPRRLFRTYYYNILQEPSQNPEGYREQQEFLDALRKSPYLEVRLGRMKTHQGVQVEKGVDIMLATDLLMYGWNDLYDVAVLVSGDGDFAYALQTAKNMGKHIEVAYFERSVSKDLLEVADFVYSLNRSYFEGLWWGRRPSRRRRGGRAKPVQQQQAEAKQAEPRPIELGPATEVPREFSLAVPAPLLPREGP
ncbi:MAG: NYN domain-containing protein [Chloroflexi bacterium]|nr:NYN domain-containing protein [Chloroflexota bacterium]